MFQNRVVAYKHSWNLLSKVAESYQGEKKNAEI